VARSIDIEEMRSERIFGKGRYVRKLVRLWCRIVGHQWNDWHFDWPYDVPDIPQESGLLDDYGKIRDPRPDEDLTWVRGCDRDCGCIQLAVTSLHSAGLLPGDRTSLFDNPIRRWMK
jgi:hypothetical protein